MDMREALEKVVAKFGDQACSNEDFELYEQALSALSHIGDGSKAEPVAVLYIKTGKVLTKEQCGDVFDICCKAQTPLYTHPAPTAQDDDLDREKLREAIVGMEVSVDVSTGDHDASHRLFGTVCEVMDNPTGKHEFMLLVADAESNGDTGTPTAQDSNWEPSEGEYDRSIHSNTDHEAWADLFMQTFPNCGADRDTMAGWFANAMMAMHDSMAQDSKPEHPTMERPCEPASENEDPEQWCQVLAWEEERADYWQAVAQDRKVPKGVQRFDIEMQYNPNTSAYEPEEVPSINGEYVRYEDLLSAAPVPEATKAEQDAYKKLFGTVPDKPQFETAEECFQVMESALARIKELNASLQRPEAPEQSE